MATCNLKDVIYLRGCAGFPTVQSVCSFISLNLWDNFSGPASGVKDGLRRRRCHDGSRTISSSQRMTTHQPKIRQFCLPGGRLLLLNLLHGLFLNLLCQPVNFIVIEFKLSLHTPLLLRRSVRGRRRRPGRLGTEPVLSLFEILDHPLPSFLYGDLSLLFFLLPHPFEKDLLAFNVLLLGEEGVEDAFLRWQSSACEKSNCGNGWNNFCIAYLAKEMPLIANPRLTSSLQTQSAGVKVPHRITA